MGKKARVSVLSRLDGITEYDCRYDWPEDCFVQAGSRGIVFRGRKTIEQRIVTEPEQTLSQVLELTELDEESYRTAFFEAFPRNPETFIRGEGKTIEDAETSAWHKLQKYMGCSQHEFEKRGYRNGAGFCTHCGMFKSKAFEPWEPCISCGEKTYFSYDKDDKPWCEKCYPQMPEELMTFVQLTLRGLQEEE